MGGVFAFYGGNSTSGFLYIQLEVVRLIQIFSLLQILIIIFRNVNFCNFSFAICQLILQSHGANFAITWSVPHFTIM